MTDSIFKQIGSVISTNIENAKNEVQGNLDATEISLQNNIDVIQDKINNDLVEYSIYDSYNYFPNSGWTGASIYSTFVQAGGIKGNQFGFILLEKNDSLNHTRLLGLPFTVNQQTGLITEGTTGNIWYNSSDSYTSTTWFYTPSGTGFVFAAGLLSLPDQTTGVRGYSYGWITTSNTVQAGSYAITDADYGSNSLNAALPLSATTARFLSAGYDVSDSKARYRINVLTGSSTITIGSLQNPSSNSSTTYPGIIIPNPSAAYQTSTKLVDFCQYSLDSGYVLRTLSAGGSSTAISIDYWDGAAIGFQMDDGSVIIYSNYGYPLKFSTYNSYSVLSNGSSPFYGLLGSFKYDTLVGIGNNQFLTTFINNGFSTDFLIARIKIDSLTGIISIRATKKILNTSRYYGSYSGMRPIWNPNANSGAGGFDKLLLFKKNVFAKAEVIDLPQELMPE